MVRQMKATDEQIELAFSKGWRPLRVVAKGFGFTRQALHLRMKRLGLANKKPPRRSIGLTNQLLVAPRVVTLSKLYPGSVDMPCERCRTLVVLTPASQKLLGQTTSVVCLECWGGAPGLIKVSGETKAELEKILGTTLDPSDLAFMSAVIRERYKNPIRSGDG